MPDVAFNQPVLRKRIPICLAVGEFANGPDMQGSLDLAYFRMLVANQKKKPRQIPIYNLIGKDEADHPEDLDKWPADGWVETFDIEGRYLMADAKFMGDTARMVSMDQVRGASIGTMEAQDFDGTPMGECLAHVVLTNKPFVTGMNVALSRTSGGETVAHHFTALKKEAVMAEKDQDKGKTAPAADDNDGVDLKSELDAATTLLAEQQKKIQSLTESNEDLERELKERQKNGSLEIALKENRALARQVEAGKIRELVSLGIDRGQFKRSDTVGYDGGDDRSDALTLLWFKNSMFGGDMGKLTFALKTFPKTEMRRTFSTGSPVDDGAKGYTAEQQEQIRKQGHNPELLEKTRGAENLTDYKRRKAAAAKG